jgi:hypothetical protein
MPLIQSSRQFAPGSLPRMAGLLFATALMGSPAVAGGAAGAAGAEATSKIFAAQVPGGAVRVLVVLSSGEWPAGGLRVEDGSGTVLAAHVERDAAAFAALDAGSRNALGAQQNLTGAGDAHAR